MKQINKNREIAFDNLSKFIYEMNLKLKDKTFKCRYCGMKFQKSEYMFKHEIICKSKLINN